MAEWLKTALIPDIKTQHRIAKMLADIDDKVENNQRINNNLAA